MKLTDILTPQTVKVPLAAKNKTEAIGELIDLLVAAGGVSDRERVLSAVMERERTRTTGIGGGLAIPHGKSAAVSGLMMAVGKPAEPLDFEAIDGKPVHLVMLLVSPLDQTGPHIQALAHISRLMSVDALRKKLLAAETAEEVLKAIAAQEAAE